MAAISSHLFLAATHAASSTEGQDGEKGKREGGSRERREDANALACDVLTVCSCGSGEATHRANGFTVINK